MGLDDTQRSWLDTCKQLGSGAASPAVSAGSDPAQDAAPIQDAAPTQDAPGTTDAGPAPTTAADPVAAPPEDAAPATGSSPAPTTLPDPATTTDASPASGQDQAATTVQDTPAPNSATTTDPATVSAPTPAEADAGAVPLAALQAPPLDYKVPPEELAALSKYLDSHRFTAVLTQGKTGLTLDDYQPSLDGNLQTFYGVVDVLMQQIPEGALPAGPIRSAALSQVTELLQARWQAAAAAAKQAAQQAGKSGAAQAGAEPDPGKVPTAVTIALPTAAPQTLPEASVVRVWGLDVVGAYNKAWSGGKPPAPLQAAVNLTFPTITIDVGKKGSWDFSALNQPTFGLAIDAGGPSGQAAINLFQAVWRDKYGPRLEADLQANLTNLKLDENPQFGGTLQLEFKLNKTFGITASLANQSDKKAGSKDYETNFSGGLGLVVHILKGPGE